MPESRLQHIEDNYNGIYPTVFKGINDSDVHVNKFQVYKTWNFNSGSLTSSAIPLIGIYTNPEYLPALGSELTYNDAKNIDDSLQSVTYFSINHLFYKYKDQPYNTFGPTNLIRTKKYLYQSASIFIIPTTKIGEGIKPASFTINADNDIGTYGAGVYGSSLYGNAIALNIKSDVYGNLYDSNINTASIVSNVLWYEGFNEFFDTSRIKYTYANIQPGPGVKTTSGISQSIGLAAKFSGNGYLSDSINGMYNRDNNYTISFFISASNTGSTQIIATKSKITDTQWPFKIQLSGSNQIIFSAAGGTNYVSQITSSATVNDWTHIACQKSGSQINMYVNGVLHASQSSNIFLINTGLSSSVRIDNNSNLYVGGYSITGSCLTGILDEIRIYNKALSSTEIGYLSDRTEGGTLLQTNHVGNVFSKQGIVVISTPDYRYDNIINLDYTASYKSTKTINELNVLTRIDSGDFNMSLNHSLTADNDVTYQPFVSGSTFNPYITTIGLYDSYGQLLAIGKLAQPIKKRNDVDMNFLIRIDLDKDIK
jgi:hypothetical protein